MAHISIIAIYELTITLIALELMLANVRTHTEQNTVRQTKYCQSYLVYVYRKQHACLPGQNDSSKQKDSTYKKALLQRTHCTATLNASNILVTSVQWVTSLFDLAYC